MAYDRVFETVLEHERKRLFTKWSLTRGDRLREVVAMRELTVLSGYPVLVRTNSSVRFKRFRRIFLEKQTRI